MHEGTAEDSRTAWSTPLLDILPTPERELVVAFSQGQRAAVPHIGVYQAFEARAAADPGAVAAEHNGRVITYGDLDRQANRLARVLGDRGVRPGDNVALFVQRSIPMLVGILATLKAGAAYVPQDVVVAPASQLHHIMAAAGTTVVLTQSEFAHLVPAPCLAIDTVMAEDDPRDAVSRFVPERPVRAEDGCYVLFTSGTTGRPNGVKVTHGNVANLLLTEPGDLGMRPGLRVGQILNISFDMAAWEILGCLAHGATLAIRGKDIGQTARTVDVLIATPTILSTIDPDQCRQVRVVAVAGEPCARQLADRWAAFCVFYNSCGPTETTIVNTMCRHEPFAPRLTIGSPTPNNTVYVLDGLGRPCRIGEAGEMWAGGDCVSAGYVGNPGLTAQRYLPDPFLGGSRLMFRTRDLGRWTPDGQLEHLGRTDDQVKIRGFRVELDSVSAVLEAMAGCTRAVTMKIDDRTLVSFVAPAHIDPVAAKEAVSASLPYYCVPSAVYPLAVLPETGNGKIDKAALRRLVVPAVAKTGVAA
jgi:D-alanine--poly(phosphoribitol) ligase subunit 1